MTRKEIEVMDPQQRLALEVVYECLQSSGTTDWKGKDIGVFFGIYGEVLACRFHFLLELALLVHDTDCPVRIGPTCKLRIAISLGCTVSPDMETLWWPTEFRTSLASKDLRKC
jgi:hypothetical protein